MAIKLLSILLYLIIRLLNLSYRYKFINREVFEKSKKAHPQGIHACAFWHQNIIATFLAHLGESYVVMASASKDGELIANALKWVGHHPVRGSSKRGGTQALELMIEKMKTESLCSVLTVDGPRGPSKKCKRGVVEIAKQTGALIQPIYAIAESFWIFNSWDKFRLPKPFTTVRVLYGEPLKVPSNITIEEITHYQELVEQALNKLEENFSKEKNYANHS